MSEKILTKEDLRRYIKMDREAFLEGRPDSFIKKVSKMRQFYYALRKCEYYYNNKRKIRYLFWKYRYRKLGHYLSWDIPVNVLGAGTRIMHPGTVVINPNSYIGERSRIHVDVNIGANNGKPEAPQLGKHVYIGPGAKLFGDITIADNIAIGANAVVNKSFAEPSVTIAGIPAKKISDKGFYFG